jgi:hypothetical protein
MLDKSGMAAAVGKLLTGLVMTVTVLSPLVGISFDSMGELTREYEKIAAEAVLKGENSTRDALEKSITASLEAYILEKAEDMGAKVQVKVTVSGDTFPVPETVTIAGPVSPYVKSRLQKIIKEDLGVLEENQTWTLTAWL